MAIPIGPNPAHSITMAEETAAMTLADLLDKLERGRIGHSEAMQWHGVDSYTELVAIVHANGRQMPGHRPTAISSETGALLRRIMRPV
jgi:hypothetical protein